MYMRIAKVTVAAVAVRNHSKLHSGQDRASWIGKQELSLVSFGRVSGRCSHTFRFVAFDTSAKRVRSNACGKDAWDYLLAEALWSNACGKDACDG